MPRCPPASPRPTRRTACLHRPMSQLLPPHPMDRPNRLRRRHRRARSSAARLRRHAGRFPTARRRRSTRRGEPGAPGSISGPSAHRSRRARTAIPGAQRFAPRSSRPRRWPGRGWPSLPCHRRSGRAARPPSPARCAAAARPVTLLPPAGRSGGKRRCEGARSTRPRRSPLRRSPREALG